MIYPQGHIFIRAGFLGRDGTAHSAYRAHQAGVPFRDFLAAVVGTSGVQLAYSAYVTRMHEYDIIYKAMRDPSYTPGAEDLETIASLMRAMTRRMDRLHVLPGWLSVAPRPDSLFALAALWDAATITFEAYAVAYLTGDQRFGIRCHETGLRAHGKPIGITEDAAAALAAKFTNQYARGYVYAPLDEPVATATIQEDADEAEEDNDDV